MKMGKEIVEQVCRFDVSFSKKEWNMLREYGLKLIKEDDAALINYAFNEILKKEVQKKS